ncbi:MAG: hypothetical protein HY040_24150 [Planctomycetes bacterium]|nr:hypothetical protein [Planctomycetota bacterium]
MRTHDFTLILSGISEIEQNVANALFEATKGDIEFNMRDRVPYLEFRRKAPTLRDAVKSAIEDVEKANVGVWVIRINLPHSSGRTGPGSIPGFGTLWRASGR